MLYQNLMKTVPWIQYYLYKIKSMTEKDVLEELDHLKKMELELDDTICSVMDYFEIFLKRMAMCRRRRGIPGMPLQADCQWKQAVLKKVVPKKESVRRLSFWLFPTKNMV